MDTWGPVWVPTAPPSLATLFAPTLQPLPVLPALAVVMATAYLAGAVRMWTTGRRWSPWATLSFLSGCAVLVVVMGFGIEGYGLRLFSAFMFQQLTLMMAVPPLLVLGRPGTLLLRATPHHGAGRMVLCGAHWGLRSRAGRVLLHPAFMVPLFLVCFYGLYLTDLASLVLSTWAGHTGLELALLAAGVLFTAAVLSRDPLPVRQSHLGRAADMFLEMPLHAFFGVIVMLSVTPLVTVFAAPPPGWGVDVIADQELAGALAWSYGEIPSVLLLLIIFVRWHREEDRGSRARDRYVDQHGDADLEAYNAYLRQLPHRSH
ncbi:cytochrome c oxidase assembly protein [uncultured Pseudokineococcus sp.]|uniref:cytochrome c oxidase assembly protein n=1 Tax=uncultured Pseudokineococcus sp. TaxID=1642928 RepID=UPI002623710D|nr:cytochrome c oxidase assembly protein [uncultured Pseudokineococcus sp.]